MRLWPWRRRRDESPLLAPIDGFQLYMLENPPAPRRKLVRVRVTDPQGIPLLDVTHPVVADYVAEHGFQNPLVYNNSYRVRVTIEDEYADMESGDEG